MDFPMTIFDTETYYLIMSVLGWLLVISQITIIWWIYRKLKKKS
jgi:cbb3-type cytochrome oxidase subunit 3